MAYNPSWTNGNGSGRLVAGEHHVSLIDAQEIADAINRRRILTYQATQDFSSHLYSGAPVRASTIDTAGTPPFHNFRTALTVTVLIPPPGSMGGDPATPTAMEWLWPINDGDEGKVIKSGLSTLPPGTVGLLPKINGTNNWTDPALEEGVTYIRTAHFNELRQAVEYIRRGRWEMPVYWISGLFSLEPDTPWTPGFVAHTSTAELRNCGYAVIRGGVSYQYGLIDVTARASSVFEITADRDCTVEVRLIFIDIDWEDPPCWNSPWTAPGGLVDSVSMGQIELTAGVPGQLSGPDVAAGFQYAINFPGKQGYLIRRMDTAWESVAVSSRIIVEFDLDSPPN
ncbi:MAG: hypothetical protein MUP47_10815 [Phycisphaerae bacterium]|nr:hypothetical protein [Phycisphaerae bacterium]